MADNKKNLPLSIAPVSPPGLINMEDKIDEIGQKALVAAQRAEELEKSKREAALKNSDKPIKAAT